VTEPDGALPAEYFGIAELRALPDLADDQRYPDARLEAARAWITSVIERFCGTSFVPRSRQATVYADELSAGIVDLPDRWVLEVTSGTITAAWGASPVPLTPEQLGRLRVHVGLVLIRDGGPWPRRLDGREHVDLTYVAGFSSQPPADIKEAALQAARSRVLTLDGAKGVPSRALAITNELGNIRLASASEDAPTGIPDVDAVLTGWRSRTRTVDAR
jgi:hypothetical protein